MFFIDLAFALVFAMVFSLFLPVILGWKHPGREALWDSMVFLFFLIFFTSWVGGVRLPQFGPVLLGGYWLPFLLTAFFVVMLLFTVVPPTHLRNPSQAIERVNQEMVAEKPFGLLFYILIVGLGAAIVIHYFGQIPWLREVFFHNATRRS